MYLNSCRVTERKAVICLKLKRAVLVFTRKTVTGNKLMHTN